jgi:hypothetical protein
MTFSIQIIPLNSLRSPILVHLALNKHADSLASKTLPLRYLHLNLSLYIVSHCCGPQSLPTTDDSTLLACVTAHMAAELSQQTSAIQIALNNLMYNLSQSSDTAQHSTFTHSIYFHPLIQGRPTFFWQRATTFIVVCFAARGYKYQNMWCA